MGTRNLTCVVKDGQFVIAKYCQWDGYYSGQGQDLVNFLSQEFDRKLFKRQLEKLTIVTPEELKRRWIICGADFSNGNEFVTFDVSSIFSIQNSHLDRDMGGGKYLKYIQTAEEPEATTPEVNFAADSLFCEYAYVIDLDLKTFEVYKGFNKVPLEANERFKFLEATMKSRDEYYPIRHVKTFDISKKGLKKLSNRWDDWLVEMEDEEEEEE